MNNGDEDELYHFINNTPLPEYTRNRLRDHLRGLDESQNRKKSPWPMTFKIVIEKHVEGYVAYPLDLKGTVEGRGETQEKAVADVKLAIRHHMETSGNRVNKGETPVLEAYLAEVEIGN